MISIKCVLHRKDSCQVQDEHFVIGRQGKADDLFISIRINIMANGQIDLTLDRLHVLSWTQAYPLSSILAGGFLFKNDQRTDRQAQSNRSPRYQIPYDLLHCISASTLFSPACERL